MKEERMNNEEKIKQLRNLIVETLSPLIGKKCILLDVPYYHNIGDILIWEGERAFIKAIGCTCIYTASYETCVFPAIGKDVTILFNGGGNLGDIYHEHVDFLIKVIKNYPDNRIIVCPQTIYYKDKNLEKKDIKILLSHKDIYICARDTEVYGMLSTYLNNRALLLPDMAFCIDRDSLERYICPMRKEILRIERNDCEKQDIFFDESMEYDMSDWPVFEHSFRKSTFLNKLFIRSAHVSIPLWSEIINRLWDWYAQNIFRNLMISEGVSFISPYCKIITTRLHGCILSILLHKEVVLIDNSYGKNFHFYASWLYDLETISIKS